MTIAKLTSIAAGFILAVTLTVPASAGHTECNFNAGSHVVTVEVYQLDDQVAMQRDGDDIEELQIDCGDATRFNTDTIVVNDPAGHNVGVFILLANGPFSPGFTNEPGTSDEIEFVFNFGDGVNSFDVKGGEGEDHFVAGKASFGVRVNLNARESMDDHDVTLKGDLSSLSMEGMGDKDEFNAGGGSGTGAESELGWYMSGGANPDSLIGGLGPDSADGEGGRDVISLGRGKDDLQGQGGNDELKGGKGADDLAGDGGDDSLDGGPGTDFCDGGFGVNTLKNCEL